MCVPVGPGGLGALARAEDPHAVELMLQGAEYITEGTVAYRAEFAPELPGDRSYPI